jgi:hypothetical protein
MCVSCHVTEFVNLRKVLLENNFPIEEHSNFINGTSLGPDGIRNKMPFHISPTAKGFLLFMHSCIWKENRRSHSPPLGEK